jgi:formate dehydrogenase assembly factor FdhD
MADENDDLVQKIEGDGVTWIEIASAGSEDEANLLVGFLDSEGIASQIENLKFHMEPVNVGKMGEIRVYVKTDDEARAQELLKLRQDEYDNLDDDGETLVTDDGATDVDTNDMANIRNEQ